MRMWTQARLAREAGVSPTTGSAIETGKIGLEGASLKSLDSLSRGLDTEQERLQRLYGEFPEGSEQGRFIKRQIREVAGRSGSVKASAMVRRHQDEAKPTNEHNRDIDSSKQGRNHGQRDETP